MNPIDALILELVAIVLWAWAECATKWWGR